MGESMSLVNDGENADKLTNTEIVIRFFQLLTTGFYAQDADGVVLEGKAEEAIKDATKEWRGELWRGFHLIESRLCPRPTNAPRPKYAQIVMERQHLSAAAAEPPGSLHPVTAPLAARQGEDDQA
jgi:hypothetical protein